MPRKLPKAHSIKLSENEALPGLPPAEPAKTEPNLRFCCTRISASLMGTEAFSGTLATAPPREGPLFRGPTSASLASRREYTITGFS